MNIIGIIPARGGSKGIPRKNLVKISNTPLIGFTIIAAKKSKFISDVIVSSDDEEIIEISRNYGADVPFIRPQKLSNDNTPMISVIKHSLDYFKNIFLNIDALVLLQPTSPLRDEKHIDEAIQLFLESNASSVVSVTTVPHQYSPECLLKINNEGFLDPISSKKYFNRQDKPKYYARNGPAIVVINPEVISKNDLYGDNSIPYIMDIEQSIDIDNLSDLNKVRKIIED